MSPRALSSNLLILPCSMLLNLNVLRIVVDMNAHARFGATQGFAQPLLHLALMDGSRPPWFST